MSFEAKGVLCFVLSLPEDWVVHKSQIIKTFSIGRTTLNRCFSEIEKEGYLLSFDHVRKSGKYNGKAYIFYDEPQALTDVSKPTSVSRHRSADIGNDTTNKTLNNKTYPTNTQTHKHELNVNRVSEEMSAFEFLGISDDDFEKFCKSDE